MAKSSDPIVHSFENATDSRAFELLCSDILAGTVYPGIEPIGGTGDGGRDALYSDQAQGVDTICAYSLRQDWEVKLRSDCERVSSLKHPCDVFLFATSMQPTPGERDKAVKMVKDEFGWTLQLHGRERLATAIRGKLEHLIERHPAIFVKAQFRLAGGRLLETSQRDVLLIDHVDDDQGFAHWVARCLRLLGYDVWCRGIDSTSGEVADTTIRQLLQSRARHHMAVFSETSVVNSEFRGRVEQSAAEERRLLPLRFQEADLGLFSTRVAAIDPVAFDSNRAHGVRTLSSKLDEWGVPKDHEVTRRRSAGLRLPNSNEFIRQDFEILSSNVFSVNRIPKLMLEWRIVGKMNKVQMQTARQSWAFVRSGDNLFSFVPPPDGIANQVISRPWKGAVWQDVKFDYYDGKKTRDVLSELLQRTLEFGFYRAGMLWCPDRELIYFSPREFASRRLPVKQSSGTTTTRAVCGKKNRWQPHGKGEDYLWQLAPDCRCYGSLHDPWEFRTRVAIRLVYADGTPLEPKRVITFRKHAATGWTQDKFRDLNLLFMQHTALGKSEIVVGEGGQQVVIAAMPKTFRSPVCIDEGALPKGASKFAKRGDQDGAAAAKEREVND